MHKYYVQGAVSIRKTVLLGMVIPMLKIRRPTGRLIFNMGISISGKTVFYIETGPRILMLTYGKIIMLVDADVNNLHPIKVW